MTSKDDTKHALFDIELGLLLDGLFKVYGYDFSHYAKTTLQRRLYKALAELGYSSLSELQGHVLRDGQLFSKLLSYLTVQVSDVFRDPDYYASLRNIVIPYLTTFPSLKVWVAGCATGEELYSLAVLFEEQGLYDKTIFYATDINPSALDHARKGSYSVERLKQFSQNYQQAGGKTSLMDYCSVKYGGATFSPSLRKNVVFADHSLVCDEVFAETHFISCRNVLIYFNERLQNRVIDLFYRSLTHGGFLGLGTKESIEFLSSGKHFVQLERATKIYQKSSGSF